MSKERAKGTRFETEVVEYLKTHGCPDAYRTGSSDYAAGDILGVPPFVIECKNQREQRLAIWVDQVVAAVERRRLRAEVPIVIHKRKMRSVADAYCTLPLWGLLRLLEIHRND